MEQLFDNLSRTLAAATSRRDALRGVLSVVFGGAAMATLPGCANPITPSCTSGCLGSDNVCYSCASGSSCASARVNSTCSTPRAGGIYCCSADNGGGGTVVTSNCPSNCRSGQAYYSQYSVCCDANTPWYDPGGHGYGRGCYPSCPYVGDCPDRYTVCH